jgi:hypothetical protein
MHPSGTNYTPRFEGPKNWANNYGARLRGFLRAPRNGTYVFWVTANDSAQLWLSSDERPENVRLVASLSQPAAVGEWLKYPWQKSEPIKLEGGRNYYMELLHKASNRGGDHCEVAWQISGKPREVIGGEYLHPFVISEGGVKR